MGNDYIARIYGIYRFYTNSFVKTESLQGLPVNLTYFEYKLCKKDLYINHLFFCLVLKSRHIFSDAANFTRLKTLMAHDFDRLYVFLAIHQKYLPLNCKKYI